MNSKTIRLGALKPRAVALRQQGKTFTEIQAELGYIAKGTLSGWLRNIELTEAQKLRIQELASQKGHTGRQKGAWINHQKRIKRLRLIRNEAESEYTILRTQDLFLAGLVLYLAEGSKKAEIFQFMNSDPYLIKMMIRWILAVSKLTLADLRFRLYIHEQYASENCELFWEQELGVAADQFLKTIYKPTGRAYKKNPAYKGCLRIEVRGSELYWRIMTWRDCLYRSIR